jgi:type III secretory pathway component EscT
MAGVPSSFFGLDDARIAALVEEAIPYARAFARVLPTASLVPALAMRGSPTSLRVALAVALAAPLAPSMAAHPTAGTSIVWVLLSDAFAGLPLALLLATPLWIAAHVGAIADALRGAPEVTQAAPPAGDAARGTLSTLAALLAASAWLASGGVTRALALLAVASPREGAAPWALSARALADGLRTGVAAAAGVLVAMIALEVALAALGRSAAPLSPQPVAMVARPVVSVLALSLSLEAIQRLVT